MNVTFVIKSMKVEGGGAERVLATVANALAERNHAVSIITLDREEGRSFYTLHPSVRCVDLALAPPGVSTPRGSLIRFIPKFRAFVRRLEPDVVVAFMHSMYAPAAVALLGTRIPLVASEHTDATHYTGRSIEARAASFARDRAAAITVPAEKIRNEFPPHWQNKSVVLSNPVDLSAFRAVPPARRDPPFRLLAVGRFMEEKNHLGLIEAFARVADEFPDWTLRIVGDGELRPQLEHKIAALKMSDRVELPGMSKSMPAEYAGAAFVVMPSLYESFGLVTAEALASGRTVLGFAECVGTAELIQHDVNGYLLQPGIDRAALLAGGLRTLMSDAALRDRLALNGPASMRRFEAAALIGKWESVLKAVASGRPMSSLTSAPGLSA